MIPGSRVMLWANYRQNGNGQPTVSVPAPVDKSTPEAPWWYDYIAQHANLWASLGFTDILFPNPLICQGGNGPGDDGYNPFDDYDIGSKGAPTRFGTAEKLRRAVAICRANGMNVWLDIVNHQRMGGNNGIYEYRSATGEKSGRFAKRPSYFRGNPPRVPEDPVPVPHDDFAFGDELCPVNAIPKRAVWDGLIAAGDWLFLTTGTQGARLDDMKGMNTGFVHSWMTSEAMASQEFFGEYDDGNPDNENWWIGQVQQRASALDFAFQENMAYPMCMKAGGADGWQMSWMGTNALLFQNPMKAVTFVSSLDSETDGWATIINNKTLGLALMLGMTGLPMVYIKDWLPESMHGYALDQEINNLVWCARNLANGGVNIVYSDAKTYVFQRTGPPGALIALNNDIWNPQWTTVTCRTQHAPGTVMHDYTGKNAEDSTVDNNGNMTFGIPPAGNGKGYGFWAPAGTSGGITFPRLSCTQSFFGADDLDIGPATNGAMTVGRVWIDQHSSIEAELKVETGGWAPRKSRVTFQIGDPQGHLRGDGTVTLGDATIHASSSAGTTGWHTIHLNSSGLPAGGAPFTFKITYAAPQTINKEQF
ncbi:MAG: hypothetical protein KGO48_18910 [Alphaproteobacteria bacterium]|nr:hypothetical protein [Alphaproteobacteria bacterium]